MATANDEIYVKIITDVESALAGVAKLAAGYISVTKALQWLKQTLTDSFQEFKNDEEAIAHLNASLKLTGQYTEGASKGLQDYAMYLQTVTTYSHDATESAMGLLMQLSGLTEHGVKQAIPVLQDWASALGIDLTTAAEQFTRMLSGSTDSMGRYHLEIAKGLDPAARFNALLDAMKSKVGGVAEEMAKTTSGTMQQYVNNLHEAMVNVGGFIAQILNPIAQSINQQANISAILKMDPKTITDIKQVTDMMDKLTAEMKAEQALGSRHFTPEGMAALQKQYAALHDQWNALSIFSQTPQTGSKNPFIDSAEADKLAASLKNVADAMAEIKFNYPSFMGDPGGLRVGEGGPTTMPQGGIFNPNQTSNGPQLLVDQQTVDLIKLFNVNTAAATVDVRGLAAATKDLGDSIAQSLAGDMGNLIFSLGKAATSAADAGVALSNFVSGALQQIGSMMIMAGLRMIMDPTASWEVGLALMIAGGFSELAGGAISGATGTQAPTSTTGSPTSANRGGVTVNNYIAGSVISERGLARSMAATASNW